MKSTTATTLYLWLYPTPRRPLRQHGAASEPWNGCATGYGCGSHYPNRRHIISKSIGIELRKDREVVVRLEGNRESIRGLTPKDLIYRAERQRVTIACQKALRILADQCCGIRLADQEPSRTIGIDPEISIWRTKLIGNQLVLLVVYI